MTESLREIWEHLVSHQVTRDIDGWVDCFAVDGIMEWPFRLKGVPARLEGREAIRAAVAPVWERATKANRRISGHEHVVFHQTKDPAIAIVEFDIVGETVRGPFRQAVVYLLRVHGGRVLLLREFVDTAALNDLFQVGALALESDGTSVSPGHRSQLSGDHPPPAPAIAECLGELSR